MRIKAYELLEGYMPTQNSGDVLLIETDDGTKVIKTLQVVNPYSKAQYNKCAIRSKSCKKE